MTAFETNFEAAMEADALVSSPLSLPQSRQNEPVLALKLKKSGSFNTATTEESSCDESATSRGKSPASFFAVAPATPSKKKSMMTMSALSSKGTRAKMGSVGAVPSISLDDSKDDSFTCTDDNEWWQHNSPGKQTKADFAAAEKKNISLSEHLPKSQDLVVGDEEQSTEQSTDTEAKGSDKTREKKKKKVKRFSVTKVKASDLGGLSAHSFLNKTGDAVADQKELQEAFKLWKVEQKHKSEKERGRRSSVTDTERNSSSTGADETVKQRSASRVRSKSKAPSTKEATPEEEPPRGRSRSMARTSASSGMRAKSRSRSSQEVESTTPTEKPRSRSSQEVESTTPTEKRSKSVVRKTTPDSDERRRSRSTVRRDGEEAGEKTRSKSLARGPDSLEEKERSRCSRGRSVAPERAKENVEKACAKEVKSRSKSLARSTKAEESKTESRSSRGRPVARAVAGRSDDEEGGERRRTKSLARVLNKSPKDSPEVSRGRSSAIRSLASEDDDASRRRSKSVGAGLKMDEAPQRPVLRRKLSRNNSSNISKRRSGSREGLTRQSSRLEDQNSFRNDDGFSSQCIELEDGESIQEPPPRRGEAISKSIPWNAFLMQAQASSRSLNPQGFFES